MNAVSTNQVPIEVMDLFEIENEFSLLAKQFFLLKFCHVLAFRIDSIAEGHSFFNYGVNCVHWPLDIIILDFDINLEHVEATMAPL